MKITLKSIKYAKFASEETHCFKATVCIDGQRAGTVSNDGHGGSNTYDPWQIEEQLTAYGATLPPLLCEFLDDTGQPAKLAIDADMLINDAFEDEMLARDMRRNLKSRVLFTRGAEVLETKRQPAARIAAWLANPKILTLFKADKVLNLMPESEAFLIYKGQSK
jgi:hypothetical protein